MMKKFFGKYRFLTFLACILLLSVVLRFPFLSVFPPAMLQDEVGIGYSAISIAETGNDEWGTRFPLIFKSFGDYKSPGFIYTTALLYKIIGWHEILPRITSALAGVFVVLFATLWIRKLFQSDELGLIAGLLLATNPWTIHLSRMGLESNLGLAFFMGGLFFLYNNSKWYSSVFTSAILFSLSSYTFHSFRYSVILFLTAAIIGTLIKNYKNLKKQTFFVKKTLLVLVLSTLLSLPGFVAKGVTGRLEQTLILTSDNHIKLMEHYENNCHSTLIEFNPKLTIICKLKYNKFTRQVLIGTDSLVKHLSLDFLFISGDTEVLRNPTQSGQFFLFLLPFWIVGIVVLFRDYKEHLVLIFGYLVAMLPSVVSGNPHATRLSVVIPFVLATCILGYKYLKEYFKEHHYFTPIFIIILCIFLASYTLNYAVDTFATHEITSTYLSYAKKVAILEGDYAKKGYTVYADHDLFPEPHMYYAYYNQIDPKITQQSFAKVYEETAGFSRPKQFGNNIFFDKGDIESVDCKQNKEKPTVFITNDSLSNLEPVIVIKDNTHLYSFVYVYEGFQKCLQ